MTLIIKGTVLLLNGLKAVSTINYSVIQQRFLHVIKSSPVNVIKILTNNFTMLFEVLMFHWSGMERRLKNKCFGLIMKVTQV